VVLRFLVLFGLGASATSGVAFAGAALLGFDAGLSCSLAFALILLLPDIIVSLCYLRKFQRLDRQIRGCR